MSLCSSCSYYSKQVPSEEVLLKQELELIDWNEVDEYPSFKDCDQIEESAHRKECFFEYLSVLVQEKLTLDSLSIMHQELDTIEVKVSVFADSKLQFEPQFAKDSTAYDTTKMDSILKARLVNFPAVKPAIKRGIPVKTQFILPVIIKVE
jgi:hypothetical protein